MSDWFGEPPDGWASELPLAPGKEITLRGVYVPNPEAERATLTVTSRHENQDGSITIGFEPADEASARLLEKAFAKPEEG